MNLVDAFVTKVISGPYEEYGKWWVDVEYISWGVPGKSRLKFHSRAQAQEAQEGFRFLTGPYFVKGQKAVTLCP